MEMLDVLRDIDILGGLNNIVDFISENQPHIIKRKYKVKGLRIYKKILVVNEAQSLLTDSLSFSLPFIRRLLKRHKI